MCYIIKQPNPLLSALSNFMSTLHSSKTALVYEFGKKLTVSFCLVNIYTFQTY